MHTDQVLVVDDDGAMCELLSTFLESLGYRAVTTTSADEAIERFRAERPAAVLLDVVLPGGTDGLGALAALRRIDRDVPVIIVSGQGRTTTVVQAMKLGATDYVCKPFDPDELSALLAAALRQRQVSRTLAAMKESLPDGSRYGLLFGGARLSDVRDLVDRAADTDVTVLVRGESGTGKELVARALHEQSARADKPFVKVNCAALPAELLESELFGYEKGAFTGALQQKPGKFEFANRGTIFLDEIGELSLPLQAKLLQVLQDGEFARLGGKSDVQVDVRVIAATNRDLEAAVADRQFREDLYFRLNVVSVLLPPLRERREDIPGLVDYFLRKYSVAYHKPVTQVGHGLMEQFAAYDWPGNVRQLENLVKRLVVLGSDATIVRELQQPALSPLRARPAPPAGAPERYQGATLAAAAPPVAAAAPLEPAMPSAAAFVDDSGTVSLKDIARTAAREAERALILRMLTRTRWNRKEAAEILGISYKALLYKIKENGLDKAS